MRLAETSLRWTGYGNNNRDSINDFQPWAGLATLKRYTHLPIESLALRL